MTNFMPDLAPKIAGLDNGKLKVFGDYAGNQAKIKAAEDAKKEVPKDLKTTLESDVETMRKELSAGKPVPEELQKSLNSQLEWWEKEGKPNFATDEKPLNEARDYGDRKALMWTSYVPAVLAVGFFLLLLYFAATGGYKQVHLDSQGNTSH